MIEFAPFILFLVVCLCLMSGFPVALTLGGVSLLFAFGGSLFGVFDMSFVELLPSRIFGTVENTTLIAVPLFIFMGVMLEKSKIAEELLTSMAKLFGSLRGGAAISVVLVGTLLAASTGIVGATVVTMGLMSLPTMMKQGYSAPFATGTICATGTLGQIIPPSIALVLLGDIMSSAYQEAQISMGIFSPQPVSVGDLFIGALVPGAVLVALYLTYILIAARWQPKPSVESARIKWFELLSALVPPLLLIAVVLGSIIVGAATPTEAAGVGALGALVLSLIRGRMSIATLSESMRQTANITAMVFLILVGAAMFSLVFRGFGGEEQIETLFDWLPGGQLSALLMVMAIIFVLGFILDFIEITFVVVPLFAPALLAMGIDPIWLGIMIAVNLQTSFLTPPFGFALFYLRGVAPNSIATGDIYKGVLPFILIQLSLLVLLWFVPELVTWLPELLRG